MNRPKCLDDLVAKRIIDAVRAGSSRVGAAEAARIGRTTLFHWLKQGAEGVEPYATFAAKVRAAEGELESELVGNIKEFAKDTFVANAWLLERRWPMRWSLRRDRDVKLPVPTEAEAEELVAKAAGLHASKVTP